MNTYLGSRHALLPFWILCIYGCTVYSVQKRKKKKKVMLRCGNFYSAFSANLFICYSCKIRRHLCYDSSSILAYNLTFFWFPLILWNSFDKISSKNNSYEYSYMLKLFWTIYSHRCTAPVWKTFKYIHESLRLQKVPG